MVTDILRPMLEKYGLALDGEQTAALEKYALLLRDWNERMNLTAITDDEGIAEKHFLDSLTLLTAVDIPSGAAVADVGTGAGFPGVVLGIARPDIKLTLIDSLGKRVKFLETLTGELGIAAECIHIRAEEAGRLPRLREGFDLVTARAVASLPVLAEYCLPLVRVGGVFAAMKGPDSEAETVAAAGIVKELGGGEVRRKSLALPTAGERSILIVEKLAPTPSRYPRPAGKIKKEK